MPTKPKGPIVFRVHPEPKKVSFFNVIIHPTMQALWDARKVAFPRKKNRDDVWGFTEKTETLKAVQLMPLCLGRIHLDVHSACDIPTVAHEFFHAAMIWGIEKELATRNKFNTWLVAYWGTYEQEKTATAFSNMLEQFYKQWGKKTPWRKPH